MRITPTWLREPGDIPLLLYGLMAFLLASIPSLLVTLCIHSALRATEIDTAAWKHQAIGPDPLRYFLGSVLFAPALESLGLAAGLLLLLRIIPSKTWVAYISAVAWGLIHFDNPARPIAASWGFLVFSYAFIAWRQKSIAAGYLAALIPHALNNAAVSALVLVGRDA